MTCGRIDELYEKLLEVVKKALEEPKEDEYCVYGRDVCGYVVPRPSAKKVYACGSYATIYRSYRLLVVPGAVVFYDVDLSGERCRVRTEYDAVVRYIKWRPHYTVCIFETPATLERGLVCAY